MPATVQSVPSLFGPVAPQSQPGSMLVTAPQSASSSPAKLQSAQAEDRKNNVNGGDAGSFREALRRAGKNEKPEKTTAKDASKPDKPQAKQAASTKLQKTGTATQQKGGKRQPNGDDSRATARPGRPSVQQTSANGAAAETGTADDPGSTDVHPKASNAQAAQPVKQTPSATSAPAPLPARPTPAGSATASASTPSDGKGPSTANKSAVRAVKPDTTGTDEPAADDVSGDAPTNGNAAPQAQNPSTAALTDPRSAVATTAVESRGGADVSASSDASGNDDADSSTGAVPASASAGTDFLSDLASVAADTPDDATKTETATAKPAAAQATSASPFAQALDAAGAKSATAGRAAAQPAAPEPTPDARFADVNHPKIVTGMRGELLPGGGTMHLRLDPPELGDLQISVHMRDGVMTAAFQTSNDQATRLLSHSLGNLKSMLEAQGVNVEKLHVQQGPKSNTGDSSKDPRDGGSRDPSPEQRQSDRREQQRREMVQRMWDKLAGKAPVDLVA